MDELQKNRDGEVTSPGWVDKLRYSKSFAAKLALSSADVKEYYAMLATELLSYRRMTSRMSWSGITFSVGRMQFARFVISGKTLCLFLAAEPDDVSGGRYKAAAAEAKKYEKTPSLLRIRSEGAARNAVRAIAAVAAAHGVEKSETPGAPVLSASFPADSFHNLLTRGLIRLLKTGKHTSLADTAEVSEAVAEPAAVGAAEIVDVPVPDVYTDTKETAESLFARHATYDGILSALSSGEATVRVTERHMLRAIDEIWVRTVEDSLSALDEIIRHPTGFIAETEEVLPIEMTKKVTGRSIMHLAQHSDYLSRDDDGNLTPTKLLNVFREDSLLTYENKFINTLLSRLALFVGRRYEIWKTRGADERVRKTEFTDSFLHGEARAKVTVTVELSERCDGDGGEKNTTYDSDLYRRVERLHGITEAYMGSAFVRNMGKNYVHPPILRTNVILKNKYFRQCLALWEFIESYDDAGYGLVVDEKVMDAGADYVRRLYDGAAMQYMAFCHDVCEGFGLGDELAAEKTNDLSAYVRDDLTAPEAEENHVYRRREEAADEDIRYAVEVALRADELYEEPVPEDDGEDVAEGLRIYRTFLSRLHGLDDEGKRTVCEMANAILAYPKVSARTSRDFLTFRHKRRAVARIAVRGKTPCLYLPLTAAEEDPKYRLRDVGDADRLADTPSLLRVRSGRALKYAKELIVRVAERMELGAPRPEDKYTPMRAEDYPPLTTEELLSRGLIRVVTVYGDKARAPFPMKMPVLPEEPAVPAAVPAVMPKPEAPRADAGAERVSVAPKVPFAEGREADYSEPEIYGLDDSRDFMADLAEQAERARKEENE